MVYLWHFLYLSTETKKRCWSEKRNRINNTVCYWSCIGNLGRQNAIMHVEYSQDIWVNTCTPVKSAMGYLMTVSCQNSVLHLIWKTAPPAAWWPLAPLWNSSLVQAPVGWVVSPEPLFQFLAASRISGEACIRTLIKASFLSQWGPTSSLSKFEQEYS